MHPTYTVSVDREPLVILNACMWAREPGDANGQAGGEPEKKLFPVKLCNYGMMGHWGSLQAQITHGNRGQPRRDKRRSRHKPCHFAQRQQSRRSAVRHDD